jgi:hypothetical protein
LRMSLSLSAYGRCSRVALPCMGRHAHTARDDGQHAPRPLVVVQYGLPRRLCRVGEPGGWSRPWAVLGAGLALGPAAHPQHSAR